MTMLSNDESANNETVHYSSNSTADNAEKSTCPEKEFEAQMYVVDEALGINTEVLNKDGTDGISGEGLLYMENRDDHSCYLKLNGSGVVDRATAFDVNKLETNGICGNSSVGFDEMSPDNTLTNVTVSENAITPRRPSVDVSEVFKQDEDGDTLLHIAVICLSLELAFYIIDNAPSFTWLNIQNKLFQTSLHLAVLTNQARLVRRLVVGGADLQARDHCGNMPIHLACKENRLDCLRSLLQPVRYEEQKRNNYDIPFQAMPQNLNSKNLEGLSCIHIATLDNNIEIVKVLAEVGADVNVKAEKSGRTILHEAAWSGNLTLVKYLLSLGSQCNINAKTYDNYTPFDFARSRGNWSVVLELATAGANKEDEKDL